VHLYLKVQQLQKRKVFEELPDMSGWVIRFGLSWARGEVTEMTRHKYSLNQQPPLKYLKEISRKAGNYILYEGIGQW